MQREKFSSRLGFLLISAGCAIGLGNAIFAAMGQAFFTLSLGIGAIAIFGSYIGKERSLMGEAVSVGALDTLVALTAGLIIFPACSAFGVEANEGPKLIFVTLPRVFNSMPGGRIFGAQSTVQTLEDFIITNNILPIGSLVYLFFCVSRRGWGWDNFLAEANTGKGLKFPRALRVYVTYILPALVLIVFVQGYISQFWPQLLEQLFPALF